MKKSRYRGLKNPIFAKNRISFREIFYVIQTTIWPSKMVSEIRFPPKLKFGLLMLLCVIRLTIIVQILHLKTVENPLVN